MDAPLDKEDCTPFIEITNRLLKTGVRSPEIKAYSPEKGFLMLSDLGNIMYLDKLAKDNSDELYHAAIDSLITMQSQADISDLPEYDEKLLRQEMMLFPGLVAGKASWFVAKRELAGSDLFISVPVSPRSTASIRPPGLPFQKPDLAS